jgi:hypothetical protein
MTKDGRSIGDVSDEMKAFQAWGSHILAETFTASKKVINGYLNRQWVPLKELKSGESLTGLLRAIRRFLYQCVSREKVRESMKRLLKKGPLTDEEYAAKELEKYNAKMAAFSYDEPSSYPTEWLTFLLIGKPNYIGLGIKNAFNGGVALNSKNGGSVLATELPRELMAGGASAMANGASSSGVVLGSRSLRDSMHDYYNSSRTPRSSTNRSDRSVNSGDNKSNEKHAGQPRVIEHIHRIEKKPPEKDKLAHIELLKVSLQTTIVRKRTRGLDTTEEENELDDLEREERQELRRRMNAIV